MRLIEEKNSIKIQIISLIVITCSMILSQYANYKVDEFTDELMHSRLKLNELEQQALEYKQYFKEYSAYLIFPVKLNIIEELLGDPNINPNAKVIANQYLKGAISHTEMIKQFKTLYKTLYIKLREQINTKTKLFNNFRENGSKWQWWRDFIFTPLQLIGVIILIIGNTQLLISISNRIKM